MTAFLHASATAIRAILRARGSSLLAIGTLGFAIGATTAIFGALDQVVLNPLPYADSDRIVHLLRKSAEMGDRMMMSPTVELLEHWRDGAESFEQIEGIASDQLTADSTDGTETWNALRVSPSFLQFAGRPPELGRMFTADEEHELTVLISNRRWHRHWGADPGVLGRSLRLNGELHVIVGVLPPNFRTPSLRGESLDLLLPLRDLDLDPLGGIGGIGRLRPGVTIEEAEKELDFLLGQVELEGQDTSSWRSVVLPPTRLLGRMPKTLWTLLASVGVVLFVACSNVAGVLIGRYAARRRELAVRSALGASRLRLATELLLESLLLSLMAGGLGVALAVIAVAVIRRVRPEGMESLERASISASALAFALALSLLAALLSGLIPALRGSSKLQAGDLKAGLGSSFDRGQARLRALLVVGQVALSFVLAVAGALLIQTVGELRRLDIGLDTERLLVGTVQLPAHSFESEASRGAYWRSAKEALARLPGVEGVAIASGVPPRSGVTAGRLVIEGVEIDPDADGSLLFLNTIDRDYLRVAGVRLVAGMIWAEEAVGPGGESPILVNETFALQYWGRADVTGQRLKIGGGEWHTVTGVVNDVRPFGPSSKLDTPQLYVPASFTNFRTSLVVRAERNPEDLVPIVRAALRQTDSRAVITSAETVDSLLWQAIAEHRFSLMLIALFAAGAVLLAAVGLYSVIAQSLQQRRKELAVRSALGASAWRLGGIALRSGVVIAVIGLVLGGILVAILLRLAPEALYTSTPPGPSVFVSAAIAVAFAVAAALLRPVLLAATIEPNRVLREE